MTYVETRARRLLPFDPTTITGIRIDGEPGITAVDSGTAEVLEASGETWLHWERNGVHHAVPTRHIAELISTGGRRRVIDLTEPTSDYSRLQAVRGARR
jgi:hypothetical protein